MRHRTIAILRGYDANVTAKMADQCWNIGMDLVEVPVQDASGWESLEAVSQIASGRAFGAGTILSTGDVARAVEMGASVMISPGLDADVVRAAKASGAFSLPGVMTPTDVALAVKLGLTVGKFFPADVVGFNWIKALKGPFPGMEFVAVGGVTASNALDWIAAGACGVAFGGSISELLESDEPELLIGELHRLIASR